MGERGGRDPLCGHPTAFSGRLVHVATSAWRYAARQVARFEVVISANERDLLRKIQVLYQIHQRCPDLRFKFRLGGNFSLKRLTSLLNMINKVSTAMLTCLHQSTFIFRCLK